MNINPLFDKLPPMPVVKIQVSGFQFRLVALFVFGLY